MERLQLKIQLDHLKPAIWRQVVVNDSLTFAQLHRVIQAAMGWNDCHMHEFSLAAPRIRIGIKTDDEFGEFFGTTDGLLDEKKARLAEVLAGKRKFQYWYDFGDDWWHTISIEKRLPADPAAKPAVLLAGEYACPPEDCGGPHGYADMLEILAEPQHPDFEEIFDWLGDFDPNAFDLEAHTRRVAGSVRRKSKA